MYSSTRMSGLATLSLIILSSLLITTRDANLLVRNNYRDTVWAAAAWPSSPALDRQLNTNEEWSFDTPPGTYEARIWARTKCNFDGSSQGSCETGDCGKLVCTSYGKAPNTLAEYALNQNSEYYTSLDFFVISLVEGLNIPMEFGPTGNFGDKCLIRSGTADINGQCPGQLRVSGGCNNPCTTFQEVQYCCTNGPCGPTEYSMFFKGNCPDAYSYPQDDATSLFSCRGGTSYKVVFYPRGC